VAKEQAQQTILAVKQLFGSIVSSALLSFSPVNNVKRRTCFLPQTFPVSRRSFLPVGVLLPYSVLPLQDKYRSVLQEHQQMISMRRDVRE
jgi:hypothetical protein